MEPAKIVLIGASSHSFGLMMLRDLMRTKELHGSHIVLVDIAEDKLDIMTKLAHRMNNTLNAGFVITSTTDRCEAFPCADIVVVSIEKQRYKMWRLDIEIPRKHGVHNHYSENGGSRRNVPYAAAGSAYP